MKRLTLAEQRSILVAAHMVNPYEMKARAYIESRSGSDRYGINGWLVYVPGKAISTVRDVRLGQRRDVLHFRHRQEAWEYAFRLLKTTKQDWQKSPCAPSVYLLKSDVDAAIERARDLLNKASVDLDLQSANTA